MLQNRVMGKSKDRSVEGHHNAPITPRPIILFHAEAQAGERAEQVREIFGSKIVRVRKFTPEYLVLGTPEYKWMVAETKEEDRATLKAISLLRYADSAEPNDTAAKALADAASILLPGHPARKELVTSKLWTSLLTRGMAGAKLVMWTNEGDTVPAVMCPGLRVALFVASAYRAVAACANCEKLFSLDGKRIDESRTQKFCTVACGQRFRQRMYRLRKKSKSTRKGNKR